jgi:hypothetical protein
MLKNNTSANFVANESRASTLNTISPSRQYQSTYAAARSV